MPTLTPKKGQQIPLPSIDIRGLKRISLPNLSTDHDEPNKTKDRMEYLDGLRGVLCVMVVFHHFRCAFRPCHVFAATAEWLTDVSHCENVDTGWNLYINPMLNGTFAVAVFSVMSGLVISHGLWKAGVEQWRIAVVKRYIRLAIPIAAAFVFSYALAGMTFHKRAAEITRSVWLKKMPMERPSPVTGLFSQIGWGVWRGTSTLNNAVWSMQYELIGSYLVFLLVAMLKGSPHSIRTRWLGALFVLLLVPNPTRNYSLQARVNYDVVTSVTAIPGKKVKTESATRVVQLDPVKHAHVLQHIHEQVNSNRKGTSSSMELAFREMAPEAWSLKKNLIDGHIVVLDSPKKKHALNNTAIFREIQAAADPTNKQASSPSIEIIKVASWKSTNPWIWYAAFVAGAWISEHILTAANGRAVGRMSLSGTPIIHLYLVFAWICASYPLTTLESCKYLRWRLMYSAASSLGLSLEAPHFWHILGAVALVFYLTVHADGIQGLLSSHPVLQCLGKLSFSLYLTHIPILYTFGSATFLSIYPKVGENETIAALITILVNLPVMVGVAYLFYKFVDQPALRLSSEMGQRLLGVTDAHPLRGHSASTCKVSSTSTSDGNGSKQSKEEPDTASNASELEVVGI